MIASIFNAEEQRIVAALAKTDPATDEYDEILRRYENLCRCALRGIDTEERILYYLQDNADTMAEMKMAKLTPITPVNEAEPEKCEEPDPVTKEKLAEETPSPVPTEEAETIPFDEIKARFVAAARSGVKVSDILAAAGYGKLSDVPANEYGRLLTMLSEA